MLGPTGIQHFDKIVKICTEVVGGEELIKYLITSMFLQKKSCSQTTVQSKFEYRVSQDCVNCY